jgi:hypothetical protein
MKPSAPTNRRRIRYVDHVLQKWLLVALVVLETVLTAAAIWGLYRALGAIADENMYRIHLSPDANIWRRFLMEGAAILGGTGVVNFFALVIADRVWAGYVKRILQALDSVVDAVRQLDFRTGKVKRSHAVLDQAIRWHRAGAARLGRLHHMVRKLPATLPASPGERAAAAGELRKILIASRGL